MLTAFLPVLIIYAAVGLGVSLTVHVFSFFMEPPGGQALFFALHAGIFPLWIPIVFLMQRATSGMPVNYNWGFKGQRGLWRVMFAGCPVWMKYMTLGFFYYALLNFAIFILTVQTGKTSGSPPAGVWHGFSGHWMAFYSAGLAMATTAYNLGADNLQPKCPNGHPVAWGDKFCGTCGAPLSERIQNGP